MWTADRIRELGAAAWEGRIVSAAAAVGVFDVLGTQGRTARWVAGRCGLDRRAVELLLNALVGMGLLRLVDGKYVATAVVGRYLRSDSADGVAWMLRHHNELAKSWARLDEVLRTGAPARGEDSGRAEGPEVFIRAMDDHARRRARVVARCLADRRFGTMLDAGGGSGAFCVEFCRRWRRLRATLFDRPGVLKVARKIIDRQGEGRRISMVAGDLNDDELPSGFDLVLLSNVIHSSGPGEIKSWFKKVHGSLRSGGILVIHDFLTDRTRTRPRGSAVFAINMLVNTEAGRVYSHGELGKWLRGVGFAAVRSARPGEPAQDLLVARRG